MREREGGREKEAKERKGGEIKGISEERGRKRQWEKDKRKCRAGRER